MWYVFIGILAIGAVLIVLQRVKFLNNKPLLILGVVLFLVSFILLPFFDVLLMEGFLVSVILEQSFPTLFSFIIGIIVINGAVYGIHILASSISLLSAEKSSKKPPHTEQYAKRRHPILTSFSLMGIGYAILMGSISTVMISSIMIPLLYLESIRAEKKELIPKFGQVYKGYASNVPKRIFSVDIMLVLILEYALFFLSLFVLTFNPII